MKLGALIVVVALLPAAAVASTRGAHVSVASLAPVSVRGTGFRANERVVVTVSAKRTWTKAVVASSRGTFRAMFSGRSIGSCEPYAVRAKGSRGSTAFVKVIPECAPPASDVLFPSDPVPKKR